MITGPHRRGVERTTAWLAIFTLLALANAGWCLASSGPAGPEEPPSPTHDPERARPECVLPLDSQRALAGAGDDTWSQLPPPPSHYRHAAIYDPVRDRMIVFGGYDSERGYLNDTWELSFSGSPGWTRLHPTGTPPAARYGHTAIYDPARDRMIVFGGFRGRNRNDVWQLSLAGSPAWTELSPSGTLPGARQAHVAIYDPVRDRMIVFGGYGDSYRSDMWKLSFADSLAWGTLSASGTPPAARCAHTAIYDPVGDRLVIFGGVSSSLRGDAWQLALSGTPAWSGLPASPFAREGHTAVYDPGRERMVIFGGYGGSYRNDAWALSLSAGPQWTDLAPLPAGREGHAAIYDAARQRMMIFGGFNDVSWYLDDVWELALAGGARWTRHSSTGPAPSRRYGHTAIYDSLRDRMIVFGGVSDIGGYLADTWELALSASPAWSDLSALGPPPAARYGHTAIYDPVRDRMIVFGGWSPGAGYLNDVWLLTFSGTPAWSEISAAASTLPPGRWRHTAIYDAERDRMIVFGGYDGSDRNDTWELALSGTPAWTELTPPGPSPAPRSGHAAFYDPGRDRMVAFGGYSTSSWYFDDAWGLSLAGTSVWTRLAPAGADPAGALPNGPFAATAVYDLAGERALLFGGYRSRYLSDAWALTWSGAGKERRLDEVERSHAPSGSLLHVNTPNPFNPATLIRYEIPWSGAEVTLAVYDVEGRLVRVLAHGAAPLGSHAATWNGQDEQGHPVSSGVYFCRLTCDGRSETRGMVLAR